jgi:hypothetical protein
MGGRNDGQHRATPGPQPNNGQRQRPVDPRADVGQLSGGENQMNVPAGKRDSDYQHDYQKRRPAGP